MHFVAKTIQSSYPDAANFREDMVEVETASAISLQALQQELTRAQHTMQRVVNELDKDPDCVSLKEFQESNSESLEAAANELAEALASFKTLMAYFAETT